MDVQMVSPDAHAAVARGVALLDAHQPDWRESINLDELEMIATHTCVLGQVFRVEHDQALRVTERWIPSTPYYYALEMLDLDEDRASAHGFCLPDLDDETGRAYGWDALEALWVEAIRNV